jgi:hypothetical protein
MEGVEAHVVRVVSGKEMWISPAAGLRLPYDTTRRTRAFSLPQVAH